jgi:phosphopantothenoylcysteine decarboxylase/phosphopantothenate--cysteine ligase
MKELAIHGSGDRYKMITASNKKKILLGVSGSIAAYKSAEVARLFIQRGYDVRVVMSNSAKEFIAPLTFEAITNNPVITDFWNREGREGIEHISWADWADVVLIAPATADTIMKLAHGSAENPLLAIALATKAPILVAPAMNVNMFEHPATKENIETLQNRCVQIIEPEVGSLACGWNGSGRLADPKEIFYYTERAISGGDLYGKKVLISTGPTREAIDPVRYLSNRSSGKMGVELAREAFRRGASVTLVHGPVEVSVPSPVQKIAVVSASDMHSVIIQEVRDNAYDIIIMAAAVADFRPVKISDRKIKKTEKLDAIKLTENIDILADLGKTKVDQPRPILVGFAVETGEVEDLLTAVRTKLESKNADLIVGNLAEDAFDKDTNRVWLVDRHGRTDEVATTYKSRIADRIFDALIKLL